MFSQKNGPTVFDLVRGIQNIDIFIKKIIRASTDLSESRLFQKENVAFSEHKLGHFEV